MWTSGLKGELVLVNIAQQRDIYGTYPGMECVMELAREEHSLRVWAASMEFEVHSVLRAGSLTCSPLHTCSAVANLSE